MLQFSLAHESKSNWYDVTNSLDKEFFDSCQQCLVKLAFCERNLAISEIFGTKILNKFELVLKNLISWF